MDTIPKTLLGATAADAVAMPAHWYYDRLALERDYGTISGYLAPKNPHPDSILWRSTYTPLNPKGEILHEQAVYWGKRGIHYHQFLKAGENTLNFQLARRLYDQTLQLGRYDADAWLKTYTDFMLTPGTHRDTYVEEYHRAFFTNYARGGKPRACGCQDVHIGGLVPIPALFDSLDREAKNLREIVQEHVALTHQDKDVLRAADAFTRILLGVQAGRPLRAAILEDAPDWISANKISRWIKYPDQIVIGQYLSPACYIPDAFPAALYLAWKYADDFSAGICANAQVGGDSCHRGAVVGALLGLANGVPERWVKGLRQESLLK
jgi:ADP-ribosylglycohydrolase